MGESVRPARLDEDITDAILDRWEANGDKPVLCAALIKRMQAATNEVIDPPEDKIVIPEILLEMHEISAGNCGNPIEQFRQFCEKRGIDSSQYVEFNQKLAKGKPVEFERMKTMIHIALGILCEKLKIDKKNFHIEGSAAIFLVGGSLNTQAQSLAQALRAKIIY